jgi:outer membrane biogenesis lipoprotein LolB
MLNRILFGRLVPIAALAALLLAGCNETASETSKDVAQARASQDSSENQQEKAEEGQAARLQARRQLCKTVPPPL